MRIILLLSLLLLISQLGFAQTYCTPTYSNNGCSFGIGLKTVIINGNTLSSNSGCASPYYTFSSSPVATLTRSVANTFTIDYLGYSNGQHCAIWIDFNQNYQFEASEKVYATTQQATAQFSGSFVLPAGAALGNNLRMRILNNFNDPVNDPCRSYGYGETEDYLVNVIDPCSGITPSITVSPTTGITVGTVVSLTSNACTGGSLVWSTGQTSNVISVTATTTGTFTYSATCTVSGCAKSSSAQFTVCSPPDVMPYASPDIPVAPGTTVTLSAYNCGGTVSWAPVGTAVSGVGSILITPSQPTTYSCTCTLPGGCATTKTIAVAVNLSLVASGGSCIGSPLSVSGAIDQPVLWRKDGEPITGATSTTYVPGSMGIYDAVLSGSGWLQQNPKPTAAAFKFAFADAQNGWAAGDVGLVWHTTNGGITWTKQYLRVPVATVDIKFFDAQNGVVMLLNSQILHTVDGGQTWSTPTPALTDTYYYGFFFVDAQNGWMRG